MHDPSIQLYHGTSNNFIVLSFIVATMGKMLMEDKTTEIRIIGATCVFVGLLFTFCGAMLFDNGLLALGNILFLTGVQNTTAQNTCAHFNLVSSPQFMGCLGVRRMAKIFTSASSLAGALGACSIAACIALLEVLSMRAWAPPGHASQQHCCA